MHCAHRTVHRRKKRINIRDCHLIKKGIPEFSPNKQNKKLPVTDGRIVRIDPGSQQYYQEQQFISFQNEPQHNLFFQWHRKFMSKGYNSISKLPRGKISGNISILPLFPK